MIGYVTSHAFFIGIIITIYILNCGRPLKRLSIHDEYAFLNTSDTCPFVFVASQGGTGSGSKDTKILDSAQVGSTLSALLSPT